MCEPGVQGGRGAGSFGTRERATTPSASLVTAHPPINHRSDGDGRVETMTTARKTMGDSKDVAEGTAKIARTPVYGFDNA